MFSPKRKYSSNIHSQINKAWQIPSPQHQLPKDPPLPPARYQANGNADILTGGNALCVANYERGQKMGGFVEARTQVCILSFTALGGKSACGLGKTKVVVSLCQIITCTHTHTHRITQKLWPYTNTTNSKDLDGGSLVITCFRTQINVFHRLLFPKH